jgi:putative hydrolase of the HAD superfamily
MSEITTILWDIGGVLLTNGWDKQSRQTAAGVFALDWDEFEQRHQEQEPLWDRGRITMREYLDRVIFHRTRPFTVEQVEEYIIGCSKPHPETIAFAEEIFRSGNFLQAAVNNEPLELNLRRIQHYGLRRCFTAFFSSCFLGEAKPDLEIYRKTLMILQRSAAECLFIDDRVVNVESAGKLGMKACLYSGLSELREWLQVQSIYPMPVPDPEN